ncbi:DNA-directed RNA polymerase subunit delta [Brevibacillus ruminantium]|uniref:Probable DNA-directed RNA polymerase subunit delta n=1 Tax=Brevibacillus ruminantium TaxID=2950604 RepID=A0ABY4WF19_9BACL|nr:DNA-directed RNA polymerase subunit delta [Brevibacillus ruminantium]USG65446.1 DNA-directed RNA polymerase subunit delta [Brevibacillus ruminantium]
MSQILAHLDRDKLNEMALVDIAYEILRETNQVHNFRDLMNQLAALRGMKEEEKMAIIAQVYTEVNIDGRFVCLGDNNWGLKRWYPTDTVEETQEGGKKKKVILDDDFDDYEAEEDLAEEYEDDEIAIFEDDEFVEEGDEMDEELDPDLEEEEEELEDEELFEEEDEELADEESTDDYEDENEDL